MSTTAAARVMARGRHIELRLWERDPAGERTFAPDEACEHVAYIQAGALIVSIGERPTHGGPRGRFLRRPGRATAIVSRSWSRPPWSRRSAPLTV